MDRPSQQRIVVYDGHCHLCSSWARFFRRHPAVPAFILLPLQSAEGRALLIENGVDPDDPTTFLVIDRCRIRSASDATIHLMASPGGAWRLWQVARIVPRPLRDWLYQIVARNRYRWFGRRVTCDLPEDRR